MGGRINERMASRIASRIAELKREQPLTVERTNATYNGALQAFEEVARMLEECDSEDKDGDDGE